MSPPISLFPTQHAPLDANTRARPNLSSKRGKGGRSCSTVDDDHSSLSLVLDYYHVSERERQLHPVTSEDEGTQGADAGCSSDQDARLSCTAALFFTEAMMSYEG